MEAVVSQAISDPGTDSGSIETKSGKTSLAISWKTDNSIISGYRFI